MTGHIFGFMSATSTEWTDADDLIESHGWIDPPWSLTELHQNRNDVTPVLSMDADDPELMEYIRELVVFHDNNGDGTFYAQDVQNDKITDFGWRYAIHFKRKYFGPNGWTEEDFIPEL